MSICHDDCNNNDNSPSHTITVFLACYGIKTVFKMFDFSRDVYDYYDGRYDVSARPSDYHDILLDDVMGIARSEILHVSKVFGLPIDDERADDLLVSKDELTFARRSFFPDATKSGTQIANWRLYSGACA